MLCSVSLSICSWDRLPTESGPVAQLGARLNGIQEVTGSNPVWSTNLRSPAIVSELRLASPERVTNHERATVGKPASSRHHQAEVVHRSGGA
jgi:hypothetical protein